MQQEDFRGIGSDVEEGQSWFLMGDTLSQFNISNYVENGPCVDDLPIKNAGLPQLWQIPRQIPRQISGGYSQWI